jgi:hypothetical protein
MDCSHTLQTTGMPARILTVPACLCRRRYQAARMFVGGVQLLGLYQYGPDGTGSLDRLCKHATAVRDALACEVGDWLILQVAFGARKYTAKSLGAGSSTALKPAELKFQPLGDKLRFHSFTATLKVHLSARLPSNAVGITVTDRLRAAADAQCAAFEQDAVLSIDGKCADGAMALSALRSLPGSVDRDSSADHGCVAHKVEVFAPNLGQPVATTDTTSDDSDAAGELFGAVTLHAVLHEKGTTGAVLCSDISFLCVRHLSDGRFVAAVADATAFLWQDLRGSLRSRLSMQGEMLAAAACDASDGSDGANTTANTGAAVFGKPTPLPRRLLLNTSLAVPGVDCCYTDYMYPDGTASSRRETWSL